MYELQCRQADVGAIQIGEDVAGDRNGRVRECPTLSWKRKRKRGRRELAITHIFATKPGTRHVPSASEMAGKRQADDRSWLDLEVRGSEFQDTRLRRRFASLLEKLWDGMGQTIPFACQDSASTKAAYRFLSNDRINEHDILSGHFQASAGRVMASDGPVLILQDTTTFSYQRERPELIGYTGKTSLRTGKNGTGPSKPLTQCGILMHSSLVVTTDGLPLGLAAVKFWTRKQFNRLLKSAPS